MKVKYRTSKYPTVATLWAYNFVPFGLACASKDFKQFTCIFLSNMDDTKCSPDDILIHSKNKTELEIVAKKVIEIRNTASK